VRVEYLIYFRGVFDKAIFDKWIEVMFVDTDIHIQQNSSSFCKLSIHKYRQSYITQFFNKLHNSKVIIKRTTKKRTKYTTIKDFTWQ